MSSAFFVRRCAANSPQSRGPIAHFLPPRDAHSPYASSRIEIMPRSLTERSQNAKTITASLTALVCFFFSSHPSQAPKDGMKLKTDPATLIKNAITWTATTAAVSNTPLVGKTVRIRIFFATDRHLVGRDCLPPFSFPISPLTSSPRIDDPRHDETKNRDASASSESSARSSVRRSDSSGSSSTTPGRRS